MVATELTELLVDLTQHSQAIAHAESLDEFQKVAKDACRTCTITLQQLHAVRSQFQELNSHGWQELAEQGVLVADATKTLNALMRYGSSIQACTAAVAYSWLLRSPDAPVHHMLDTLAFSGCLQCIKEAVFASTSSSKGKAKGGATQQKQQHAGASDAEDNEAAPAADPSTSRPGPQAVSSTDYELCLCLCHETLVNLAAMAQQTQLKSCDEVLAAGLEGVTDFLSSTKTAKIPSSSKGLGLTAGSISAAAYTLLEALFDPRHGSVEDMAASLLPRLTPLMVGAAGPAAGKRTATDTAATRAAAVAFVREAYRRYPAIQDAVAALARHICLKAQDKADSRTAATKACAELVTDLPQPEQEQFVGFVYKLSTSKQLGLRTLSVGLANHLLMNLPEPFKRSTFAAAQLADAAAEAADGDSAAAAAYEAGSTVAGATPAPTRVGGGARSVPEGMVVAPWSVVALAALLNRCSDKSAVVRARALADLAEVVDCFANLLAEDPSSVQYQVAEAFVEGLEAAAAMQIPLCDKGQDNKQQRKKRRAGNDEDDSDADAQDQRGSRRRGQAVAEGGDNAGDESEDDDEADQDKPQRQRRRKQIANFVAYIPRHLSADVNSAMSLVHRRCGDTKAAVRKGALQLLEALLVMRASWQGYPRQLPGSADLALLEAATADPLVSVRKAALVALSTLLELFPAEPSLCQAWVASVLPLVRDVEVAVQDSLADWAGALLFDKAAVVGSSATHKKSKASSAAAAASANGMDWQAEGSTAPAAETAGVPAAAATYAELRQLLSAVASIGRAAGACLGKLCASMAAKKKLKATAVARGLEAVIAGTPAGSPCALGAWILLKELAVQDPAAPSWQFLQKRWAAVRATAAGAGHSAAAQALETVHESDEQEGSAAHGHSNTGAGLADEAASLLLVISQTAAGFPTEQAEDLASELLQHILSFHLPPTAAGAHVSALFKLTEARKPESSGNPGSVGAPAVWAKQVYNAAHEHLRRYVNTRSGSAAPISNATSDHTTCVAMFTVGEVALLKAAKPPSGLTVILQALTAHNFIPSAGAASTQCYGSSQVSQDVNADLETQLHSGLGAESEIVPVDDPVNVHMLATQAVFAGGSQSGTQLVGGTQGVPLTQAAGGSRAVPSRVQGHAWIALGKVCMVDEGLAKKCVPLFVQELGRSPYPVVRNNIMVALSDMLIQYTALVDAHMPRLAACIRDRHELVRRQALALLANLLMKDYVKWRGPLFHRFLLAIVDPSPAVRQLAEYLLKDVIAIKAPLLAYNHFVEALFVLNGCAAGLHGARLGANMGSTAMKVRSGGVAGSDSEQQRRVEGDDDAAVQDVADEELMAAPAQFTLKGKHKRASRDIIYSALLRAMSPEHKFSSAAKLCGEVLAGVADGLLPLVECEEVLRDALCLLASKDIKVSANRLAAHDEDELPATQGGSAAGGSATAAEAAARARGKLVSALMKRHLVEQVVPVLVELRRLLAEVKHPLLSELMACFAALLKEYKGEVEDILVADKQLAKEILYDIKQAELAKAQQQQHQQSAAVPSRPPSAANESSAPPRNAPPPPGVMPGTPAAAEVLATAEKLRRQQQAGGAMPAPPPRPAGQHTPVTNVNNGSTGAAAGSSAMGPGGVLRTPAPASGCRLGVTAAAAGSSAFAGQVPGSAARVLKTPAAVKTPGSAAAVGRMSLASPAPVTVSKTGARTGRKNFAGVDENEDPGSKGMSGVPDVSYRASHLLQRGGSAEPTNILLPSPYKTNTPRQWNVPQHVATGEKQQQTQRNQQDQRQLDGVQMEKEQKQQQRRGAQHGKRDTLVEEEQEVGGWGRGQKVKGKGSRAAAVAAAGVGVGGADGDGAAEAGRGAAAEGRASRSGRSKKSTQSCVPAAAEAAVLTTRAGRLRETNKRTASAKQNAVLTPATGDEVKVEGSASGVKKGVSRKRRNM